MTGILASGATVTVGRIAPEPHPLKHGTPAEIVATFIRIMDAAEVPKDVAELVLNRSRRMLRHIAATTPPIKLHAPPRHADAGRW